MSRNTSSSRVAAPTSDDVINTIKSVKQSKTSSTAIEASSPLASNTISSVIIETSAPFSNSTTTTKRNNGGGKTKTRRPSQPSKTRDGNPGKGDNNGGGKGQTNSAAPTKIEAVNPGKGGNNGGAVSTTSLVASTTVAIAKPTKIQGVKPGKGAAGRPQKPTKKQIITVIRTFFIFRNSHGAACPAVKKSGNKWNVLNEFFDDLKEAAAAACGHQFTACIKFNGPNFSIEECRSQKNDCAAVATTQRATASAPAVITASVTIPVEAAQPTDIPGTIVSIETIVPPASTVTVGSEEDSAPTSEVIVQATASSSFPAPTIVPSNAPFSNSTSPGLRRRYR